MKSSRRQLYCLCILTLLEIFKNNDVRSVKETSFFSADCSSCVSAWIVVVSGKDETPKEKSRVKVRTDFCIFFFIHVSTSNMWWYKTGMVIRILVRKLQNICKQSPKLGHTNIIILKNVNFFSCYMHINPRNNLSSFTLYFDYTKQSSRFSYLILTNSLSRGYFKILAVWICSGTPMLRDSLRTEDYIVFIKSWCYVCFVTYGVLCM